MNDELTETEAVTEIAEEELNEKDFALEAALKEDSSDSTDSEDVDMHSADDTSVTDNDLAELKEEFPELRGVESITELANPIRYAALRDLGLSPAEAYLLTSRKRMGYDNRSHLTTSVPAAARSPRSGMSARELEEARQLFGDISDSEIYRLYKKVTK